MNPTNMQCPDCGSCRRGDGYNRDGWYWLECGRRYNPDTDVYSPPNSRCKLYQLKREYAEFRAEIRGALPQPSNPAVSNKWIVDAVISLNRQWARHYRSLAEDVALAYDVKREQWREYVPETIADEIDALIVTGGSTAPLQSVRDVHTVECTAGLLAGHDCVCGYSGVKIVTFR